MYKVNGLPHFVDIHGQNFAKAQTLPQNTSADGNGGAIELSGINGAVEAVARINTAVTIADTKALTIKLQHSADGSSWTDLGTIYSLTAAGGNGALAAGVELGRFALPSTVRRYVKAVITTTDAAATGKVDVIPAYLPR
ncbi:Bbp16 family capsid cement protein [Azospirillum himalayense]|uniref:Bbp16 family capsid cement protein n=1 Tax=Azospirillum himalayense TaxID=654847 RepID=A0ABW0G561_9PROT